MATTTEATDAAVSRALAGPDSMPQSPDQKRWLAAAGVLIAWVLVRVLYFEGFCGADDFAHLHFAWFWDRWPQNHWEARLVYNALLWASLRAGGFSQASAALPTLLGSLLVLIAAMAIVWNRPDAVRQLWVVGLLTATLPAAVDCTTPIARPLAVGLLSLGFALLLVKSGRAWALLAGGLLGLALACHLAVLFCLGAVLLASVAAKAVTWRATLLAGVGVVLGFVLADTLVYALWTGDPFYRFGVIAGSHMVTVVPDTPSRDLLTPDGGLNVRFFLRPIGDLLLSKTFTVVGGLALAGGLILRRRLDLPSRALLWALAGGWLLMSYGTHKLGRYEPLPGTITYWGGLALPMVVLAGETLCRVHRRRTLALLAGGLIVVNLAVLSLHGPWGQSVKLSEEMLDHVRAQPEVLFVSDDRTIREMVVLSGFRPPENLRRPPDSTGYTLVDVARFDEPAPIGQEVRLLVNALNEYDSNDPGALWMRTHRGEAVYQGQPRYRLLTYLVPQSYRERHPWMLRRPAATLHQFRPLAPVER